MSKKKRGDSYPLKSLHDFLNELDKEWDRFRTASLVGIVTSGILVVFVFFRFLALLLRIRRFGWIRAVLVDPWVFLFLILAVVFLVYEMYLLIGQYRFFKKWERRMGLLLHLEEKLMQFKEEDREEV